MEQTVTAFRGDSIIASGSREEVTRVLLNSCGHADGGDVLVFDDSSGRITDLNYRDAPEPPRGRGRPKLGVTAREITLLPRHWEWLAGQPGGASAVLRRLVEEASRAGRTQRERRDSAYHFMQAACGDRPRYEEALRLLYRGEEDRFAGLISDWPEDVRLYLERLLAP